MQSAAALQAFKIAEFFLEGGAVKPLYVPVGNMKTAGGYMTSLRCGNTIINNLATCSACQNLRLIRAMTTARNGLRTKRCLCL